MSELKTYKMVDEKYCTDCVCVIPSEVYLKSEADKVIAEKDTKIIQLEALIENHNRISKEIIDNANHQKHKRCLAMAKLTVKDDYAPWNMKWYKRWLEIAEKFKEALDV